MDEIHAKEVEKLHSEVSELYEALRDLSTVGGESLQRALKRIHPPYTTPAEFLFSQIVVKNIREQIKSMKDLIHGFSESVGKVSEKVMAGGI